MKRLGIISSSFAAVLLTGFCGCHSMQPATVRDSTGATVVLNKPACRIISTVPSNTEILYALGLKDQVVGLTEFCGKTCDTKGKTIIGGWVNPDFEKIRSLKPDLIFAFGGIQKGSLDKLREIAPTYCFEPATVEDTLRVVLDIGRLTNRDLKAKEIVDGQRAILARLQSGLASIPPHNRLRVARVFGTNSTVMTAGGKSFLTDIINTAGGTNVFGDVKEDYPSVPFACLAALDPDVLIVHGEKAEVKARQTAFAESPEFSKLKAVKNDRVLVYSCDYICHPNAAIAKTVEMVAKGLYPDLFANDK